MSSACSTEPDSVQSVAQLRHERQTSTCTAIFSAAEGADKAAVTPSDTRTPHRTALINAIEEVRKTVVTRVDPELHLYIVP